MNNTKLKRIIVIAVLLLAVVLALRFLLPSGQEPSDPGNSISVTDSSGNDITVTAGGEGSTLVVTDTNGEVIGSGGGETQEAEGDAVLPYGAISAPESSSEPISDELQTYIQYYFRSNKQLQQHYEKHGIDMGFASAEEYEQAASDVANSPDALHKTEKEDGDDVYYIEATNDFVVVSTDGYIRTYFWPDAGKAYFDRQ